MRACLTNPAAAEIFSIGDLYQELCRAYQELERLDDALAAADSAIAAESDLRPDPRSLRAEVLLKMGRNSEAETIWAALRADNPDDAWLYNSAALAYAETGQYDTALEWSADGLRRALRSADNPFAVDQLYLVHGLILRALGRPDDQLFQAAEAWLESEDHNWDDESDDLDDNTNYEIGLMAFAWLSADEYEQARQLWPDFAASDLINGPDGPLSHAQYSRALQQKLVSYAEPGAPNFTIVPIKIAPYTAWCAEEGRQADSADARARYAAYEANQGSPDMVAWPPERNERCWCGSGRKYKKCCGSAASGS